MLVLLSATSVVLALVPWLVLYAIIKLYVLQVRSSNNSRKANILGQGRDPAQTKIIGFFHPYCHAGGGGERVLWTAIRSIQERERDTVSVVYTGDTDATKEEIIQQVKARFNIILNPETIQFVFLDRRWLVEASTWPYFTLLGQSIGSMALAWEALTKLTPDLFLDTMGYAFTFPVVGFVAGSSLPIGAYVHYPTITTTMLNRVQTRQAGYANSALISSSSILSWAKLLYYRIFMSYYSLCLRNAHFLMANGTWTRNHISSIIAHSDPLVNLLHYFSPPLILALLFFAPAGNRKPLAPRIVYPPCPTHELSEFPLTPRERVVLCIGQFRPEKAHKTQLRMMADFFDRFPKYRRGDVEDGVRLVLIGGARHQEDRDRVDELRELAKQLGIEKQIIFLLNTPHATLLEWLSKASVGLSTMVDEHFGIGVVETMAAGLIPLAHASGGPLHDIVVPYNDGITGMLALDPASFATQLDEIFSLSASEELAIRRRARDAACEKFSEEKFLETWWDVVETWNELQRE